MPLGFWKLWVIRFRDHQPESVSNISSLQRRENNGEISYGSGINLSWGWKGNFCIVGMMIYLCGSQMKGGDLFCTQILDQVKRVCSSILNEKQWSACDTVTSCRPQEQNLALACFVDCIEFSEQDKGRGYILQRRAWIFSIVKGCVKLSKFCELTRHLLSRNACSLFKWAALVWKLITPRQTSSVEMT